MWLTIFSAMKVLRTDNGTEFKGKYAVCCQNAGIYMHFCNVCANMYYIKLSETDNNELNYYCRNCGNNDAFLNLDNICVSKTQLNNNTQKFNLFINEYTKLDPSLPRTNSIKCPNEKCITNGADSTVNKEVIYIRYDDTNMKYIYLCCNCDNSWKTNT